MSHAGRTRPGNADLIDFVGLAAALLDRAHILVAQWLPYGVERNGRWYVGDFHGSEGESANVNLVTGQWIDNAAPDEDKGGDLISLYACIRGLNNAEAARELMRDLGWGKPVVQTSAHGRQAAPATPEAALAAVVQGDQPAAEHAAPPAPAARETRWQPIVPVPPHAPAPKFVWAYKDKQRDAWVELTAVRHWAYEFEGTRYGYVARFERENSKGETVKDTLPLTWCTDTQDAQGSQRWHWKQWDAPRPLYVPATLLAGDPATIPVVLVEGEKCAEAGHQLLGHEFDFVSWPGGCKAWAYADWSWLAGRTVYLWPDADAQRFRLNRAEREANVDPESKNLFPLAMQPGYATMAKIGGVLLTQHRCQVLMVRMKEPGVRPGGWDLADAIADGWDAVAVRDYIRGARTFEPADDAVRAGGKKNSEAFSTPSGARAGTGGEGVGGTGLEWRDKLLCAATGATKAVRENVVLALDGMPMPDDQGGYLPGIEEAAGVIAFNEFTNNVEKTAATPWGTSAGVWEEVDELEMGNWLTRSHYLPSMPRGTLEEAVAMVAWRHRYHPVRAEFEALRGTWDGTKRLGSWLASACMEEDELDAGLQAYLARVGTWLLMGICARIMQPGCKFDYMVIFEGPQGVGKSTLAKVLGGDHFADTGLVLGEKDSYQNLQGVLIYEWGELDALSKADVRKVKQFISSQKDRFRASFDRRPKDYPRQVVFIGTTNEDHYLVDQTGNRRFWPVRINRHIDLEWVRANRAQLFAEALSYLDAGERFHPSPREQRELFDPQQQQRQVEDAVQAAVLRYLYDENQRVTGAGENGTLVKEITVQDLLTKVGITIDKQTHVLMRQATGAMRHAGWERFRSSRGDRPWMFRRPTGAAGDNPLCTPQAMVQPPAQGTSTSGGGNDIPF
jgi:putative DNA primase/helicase